MKLPDTEIEKACATKDNRAYLNQPWLDAANKKLIATDGAVIAIHTIEVDKNDTTGPITIEAIKTARKLKYDYHGILMATPNSLCVTGDVFARPKGVGVMPKYEQVIPEEFTTPPQGKPHLIINADQLLRLAKTLNKKGALQRVCLWFPTKKDAAIYVKGSSESGFGLIMPLKY